MHYPILDVASFKNMLLTKRDIKRLMGFLLGHFVSQLSKMFALRRPRCVIEKPLN